MVGQNHLIEWSSITDLTSRPMFEDTDLPFLMNSPVPITPTIDSRGFHDVHTATLPKSAYDPRLDSIPEHQDTGRYDAVNDLEGSSFPEFPWE